MEMELRECTETSEHKIQTLGNHPKQKEYEIFLVIPVSIVIGSNLCKAPTVRPGRPTGGVDITPTEKRKKQNVKMRSKRRGLLNIYRAAAQY